MSFFLPLLPSYFKFLVFLCSVLFNFMWQDMETQKGVLAIAVLSDVILIVFLLFLSPSKSFFVYFSFVNWGVSRKTSLKNYCNTV